MYHWSEMEIRSLFPPKKIVLLINVTNSRSVCIYIINHSKTIAMVSISWEIVKIFTLWSKSSLFFFFFTAIQVVILDTVTHCFLQHIYRKEKKKGSRRHNIIHMMGSFEFLKWFLLKQKLVQTFSFSIRDTLTPIIIKWKLLSNCQWKQKFVLIFK